MPLDKNAGIVDSLTSSYGGTKGAGSPKESAPVDDEDAISQEIYAMIQETNTTVKQIAEALRVILNQAGQAQGPANAAPPAPPTV